MFKKVLSGVLVLLLIGSPLFAESTTTIIDEFKALERNPKADRIEKGAHSQFDDVYIKDGEIQSVKGRDRLNSSAVANLTTNGFWYYENAAASTKKLVRMENTILASYDIDGTNRTVLNTGLTNEAHDAYQDGDTLYITSDTDGLYKWTGSGAASAISGVAAPSTVDFSATTGFGGMTPGVDAIVSANSTTETSRYTNKSGTCVQGYAYIRNSSTCDNIACTSTNGGTGSACFSSTNFTKTCATSTTYQYKVTKYSSVWGIESEGSTTDSATLSGKDTVNYVPKDGFATWSSGCATNGSSEYSDYDVTYSGDQTRTTGTLASAPSAPFDGYRVYRTVAGGSDYFLLGYQTTGAYTDGKPDLSLGTPFDATIDTITPPSYRYIAGYKGVLFLAQNNLVYYSHLPVSAVSSADTYWLESDKISTGGRTPIMGLHPTSNSLFVFSADKVQEITGFGATSFRLKNVIDGVGAVSDETIESDSNGDVIFFAGVNGVYKLKTTQQAQDDLTGATIDQPKTHIVKISAPYMNDVFRGTDSQIALSISDYASAHAYYDFDNDLYFLYIGQHCFIFDNANSAWSHLPAAQMTGSVYRKSPNTAGVGVLIDNKGFLYNNWTGNENGIESGTVTGTTTSSGNTTLTDSTATFNTTNDGLKGLWVYLDNENGEYRQITSNTGTQITVTSAWTTNPMTADHYYIAYIIPHVKTKQYSLDKAPKRTSQSDLWIVHNKAASTQNLDVYGYQDKATAAINATNAKTIDLSQKFADKLGFNMNSPWVQWELKTYIYNTSNTINPPLDITAYGITGEVLDENAR
jgi:hypothetical protein